MSLAIDATIRTLSEVISHAATQDQERCVRNLRLCLADMNDQPDVPAHGLSWSWREVQRQCSLAITALDSVRRPPTRSKDDPLDCAADARVRAVACVKAAFECACGRSIS